MNHFEDLEKRHEESPKETLEEWLDRLDSDPALFKSYIPDEENSEPVTPRDLSETIHFEAPCLEADPVLPDFESDDKILGREDIDLGEYSIEVNDEKSELSESEEEK